MYHHHCIHYIEELRELRCQVSALHDKMALLQWFDIVQHFFAEGRPEKKGGAHSTATTSCTSGVSWCLMFCAIQREL